MSDKSQYKLVSLSVGKNSVFLKPDCNLQYNNLVSEIYFIHYIYNCNNVIIIKYIF